MPVSVLCTVALPERGTSTHEETEQMMRLAVGAVESIINALFAPREPVAPGEGNVRVASLDALSRMLPLFADRESVAL